MAALLACGGGDGPALALRPGDLPEILPTEEDVEPYGSLLLQAEGPTRAEDAATVLSISDEVDAEIFRLLEDRGFVAGWARVFQDDLAGDVLLTQALLFATAAGARDFLAEATEADLRQVDAETEEARLGDRSEGFCVPVLDLCEVRFVLGNAVVVVSLLTGGELEQGFRVVRELGAVSEVRMRETGE